VQNRLLRVAAVIAALGFVAACEAPTPTALNGDAPNTAAPSSDTPKQASAAKEETRQIVVEPGQSVSRIAAKYHMPRRTIIAANDLTPPYKIKIGQQLRIPGAGGPPTAPAVAGSPAPEIIPLDRPALPGSTAPPPTAATAAPTASPEPPPVAPALQPAELAAPADDKSPAPATTAAAAASNAVPAAAPPGVTCPSGTIGLWSDRDIIKLPVYICRKPQAQG
jgi:LysM repeat protein